MATVKYTSKAPRWITTEAGQWAWEEQENWRSTAADAFSVQDRKKLLAEAERMRKKQNTEA
ncbi:MAG: hypothetical protein MUD01_05185 [Chloroflexaceae bacterium]|jgi:hypothetical protein|nr:hypothetical protein [Chloroflexaceae bacterium]